MAVVNIPMGGTTVAVDVPDFAMEATQQDLLAVGRNQLQALQQIASINSRAGQQQQQSPSTGETKIASEINKSSKKSSYENKTLAEVFAKGVEPLQSNNLSGLLQGMGNLIPGIGGVAGGALGFAVNALEQFGNSLSLTSRVGIGVTESLHDMRDAAATMGLNLEQFGKMVVENGRTLAAFGGNTERGYQRLADLSDEFRRATLNVGHFGLGTDEMNQVLLDEIELRRVTLGQEQVANMNLQELAQSVRENRIQQLAMARLTGQDVRERMEAQKELQANVIAQEYMTGATEETREKLQALAAGLSAVPGGDRIRDALISSIATGVDPRAFEGRLFAMLGPQAQGMIDFVMNNLEGGMSSGQFARDFQRMASGLAEGGDQLGGSLSVLAAFGDAEAAQVLAIRNQTVRLAESQEEFNAEYNLALDALLNSTNLAVTGINNQFDTLTNRFRARAMDFAAELFGGLDEQGTGAGLLGTLQEFNDALDTQGARDFFRNAGTAANELVTAVAEFTTAIADFATPGDLSNAIENMFERFEENGAIRVRIDNINELPVSPTPQSQNPNP